MDHGYYLEMTDINKTFPGAKVLSHIDFCIRPGEVRALMGENGAGKSTLIKILGGIYQKDKNSGMIKIMGREAEINSVKDAGKYGISIIHQELCLADNMSVADNIFMGCELLKKDGFMDDKSMRWRAREIMDEMEVDIDVKEKVGNLSIAKQQMIEICKALLAQSKLIVMDEPTSSLTSREIEQLFKQIAKLKAAGIAIIYISHRMDEIFHVSDSVSVLRDGSMVGTKPASELTTDKIIELMVGRNLDKYTRRYEKVKAGKECLRVEKLCNKKLKNISFSIREGEILGFAGLVGAGRTELARAIFGIDSITSGAILVDGKKTELRSSSDAISCGIGYVPENRKEEGLFLDNALRYNMTITVLEHFIRGVFADRTKENNICSDYISKLSVKTSSPEQDVRYLSGGNQQKVVLAKWLATRPKILILDEPTRGIDVGAKTEIYNLIHELAKQGVAVIMISSEMEEILHMSTRAIVMCEGEIKGAIGKEEMETVTQEQIMWFASGGKSNE